jgi:hypothetical protein
MIARYTRNGGARRDRTDDLMLAKHALSQLSYGPIGIPLVSKQTLVGPGRFELPTPRLSSVCSNQLSYGPSPAAVVTITGLAIPLPFPGRLNERPRRARGSGRETRTAVKPHLFCRDVCPNPKIRPDSPAAMEISKTSETGHSRSSLERR